MVEFQNPLGQAIFERSYALKNEKGKVIETFEQACHRLAKFAGNTSKQIAAFEKLLLEQKIVPGGRWWYGAGRKYPQISNCFTILSDPNNLGKFCQDLCVTLMTGGGVGSNYSDIPAPQPIKNFTLPFYPELYISKSHKDCAALLAKFPHLVKENPNEDGDELTVGDLVKDNREGWGRALKHVADSMLKCEPLALNLSDIRPQGTPLKGMGGFAGGPELLVAMIDGIVNVILRSFTGKQTLGPIDWMKIANFIGRYVSQSGSRRSAQMAMLHWQHPSIEKFIVCKDTDGELEGMNISLVIDNTFVRQAGKRGTRAHKIFNMAMDHGCIHGEPGLWNQEEAQKDVPSAYCINPCGEISMPAFSCCNLGHINLAAHKTLDEIKESAKLVTELLINGTTKSKLPLTEMYAQREKDRRIGVGILGLHTWLVRRGKTFLIDKEDEKFFEQLYTVIRSHATTYAKKLKIRSPEAVTTVAPTGTVSFLCGVTSGVEPMFCAAYKRRYYEGGKSSALVEKIMIDPLAKECLDKGIKVQDAFSLSVEEHLDVQIKIQRAFVDHSVSKTINLPTVGTFKVSKVKKAILNALKQKVRGITVYPNGARGNQPIEPVSLDEALKLQDKAEYSETKCSSGTCEI